MRVVWWPGEEPSPERPSVVTLGVFDGVHRGHAAVIRAVVAAARERSCHAVVVTFDRHPGAVLRGEGQPAITSLEHRIRLFAGLGADLCVVIRFCAEVAEMRAEEFLRRIAQDVLCAELLVLGFDCRFGRAREGDVGLCRKLGSELGFEVSTVPPVVVDGEPVSSTAIREAVVAGDLERAQDLLGRPFSVYGTVVKSDGRGQSLGYPTANLDLHNEAIPPDGVYAGWAYVNGDPLPSVVSVGRRGTFHHEPDAPRVVEVHILGYRGDLYGRNIEAAFVARLRSQETFEDAPALIAQIANDVEAARRALGSGS
jgi:riboflavin kinase/FMN adenylyltransferase